jgi:DNA-binding transcriptional LysR family regulator
MEIRQLRYFLEINKQKSFSKAAERLYISSQGLSMAIQRLETELGCKLFRRAAREKIYLSEDGEFLLPYAELIDRQFAICEEHFLNDKNRVSIVRIASAYGAMPEFAGKIIFNFEQEHKNIGLRVSEYPDVECDMALEREDADIGFGLWPIDDRRFETKLLYSKRFCLLVQKDHPLANEASVSLDILHTTPIMVMNQLSKTNTILMDLCKKKGIKPRIQWLAGEVIAIHRLVSAGAGVGISVESVAEALNQENVRAIPFDEPGMLWSAYLMKKRGAQLTQATHTFERFFLKRLDEWNAPAASSAANE